MIVVFFVETINLGLIYSNDTALDIIKNFVSLIIISELDDFYFLTIKEERLGKLITSEKIKLDDKALNLKDLVPETEKNKKRQFERFSSHAV